MGNGIKKSNGANENRKNESSSSKHENYQRTTTSRMQPSKPNAPNPGKNK